MMRHAIRVRGRVYRTIASLLIVSIVSAGILGDEPPREKKDKTASEGEAKAVEQARREAEKMIRGIELEILRDDKWTKAEQIEKPLLFFSDPTRNDNRGTVWGWGGKGRPAVVLELYQHVDKQTSWVFAVCNTSGGKVRAQWAGAPWWNENESATELKDIPGAPAPAAEVPLRQLQLKKLAEKFTGHQFWDPDNTRYELRLLKRPLYSYRDEANGLLDGALFTLANATNPEILLFIEARVDPKQGSKRVWQFAVGRLAHAELHMEYDGKEIFEAPRGGRLSGPDSPYWAAFLNTDVDSQPKEP